MQRTPIHKFISDQLSRWPLACKNFRALKDVRLRTMTVGGLEVTLQHNPARMISSAARTDAASLAERPCFLCRQNRPAEQVMLPFEGRKGKQYDILVNPYPIFPDHLVIANASHSKQSVWKRFVDMLDLSRAYRQFIFFYNGPNCGASAPDHHHFQAAGRGQMPLENDICRLIAEEDENTLQLLESQQDASLYKYGKFVNGIFLLRARSSKSAAKLFYRLIDCAPTVEGDSEPRFNLFSWYENDEYRAVVVFRTSHRSSHYFSDGPDHLTMSPGCVDMMGLLIVPVPSEFESVTEGQIADMLSQVCIDKETEETIIRRLTRRQPMLEVGILSAKEIEFEIISDGAGVRRACLTEGKISYDGTLYDELYFDSMTPSTMFAQPSFVLHGVKIGIGFHWEQSENQSFAGALKIVVGKGCLHAVNIVGIEDYLVSVISSEMKASSELDFLKAHAVISRSWVMKMMAARRIPAKNLVPEGVCSLASLVTRLDMDLNGGPDGKDAAEHIKWYGRDEHRLFDVCADDHCQRYQGLTRAVGENVRKAVDATWGKVLTCEGELVDARFSKSCGGVMERYSTCWEDRDFPYLQCLPDTPGHAPGLEPFCARADEAVMNQVLNGYDAATADHYRWEQRYEREEASRLLESRSGFGLGTIREIKALERGGSGRIRRLYIRGDKGSKVIGKELEIRKLLSTSHLKSSAFDASWEGDTLVLKGRGWGHGVGLCQIGAAVMASEGYSYDSILLHYYPGSEITEMPR
ncbi:MAG: DUF4922 domain-containing protein [Bacteroidales bacterium]|nr:DUF4922 domain-containing protein [Bacteroidales bacterium]